MKALTVLFASAMLSVQIANAQMSSQNDPAIPGDQLSLAQNVSAPSNPITQATISTPAATPAPTSGITPAATPDGTTPTAAASKSSSEEFSANVEEQMFRLKVRSANLQYQINALKAEIELLKQQQH